MPVGTRSPEKVAHYIEGAEWPATKEQLVEKARGNAAPPEVVEELMRLPGVRFETPEQVKLAYEVAWPDRA